MKQLQINSKATLANIRRKYPSAAAFARQCGATGHTAARRLYFVLSGERGQSNRASVEKTIFDRLRDEGLLVANNRGGCDG